MQKKILTKVTNLIWSPDDLTIYSNDNSGQILEWDLEDNYNPRKYSNNELIIDKFDLTFDYSAKENYMGNISI